MIYLFTGSCGIGKSVMAKSFMTSVLFQSNVKRYYFNDDLASPNSNQPDFDFFKNIHCLDSPSVILIDECQYLDHGMIDFEFVNESLIVDIILVCQSPDLLHRNIRPYVNKHIKISSGI